MKHGRILFDGYLIGTARRRHAKRLRQALTLHYQSLAKEQPNFSYLMAI
jgi:hypothetical protein